MSSHNDWMRKSGKLRDPSGNDIYMHGWADAIAGRPNATFTINALWGESASFPYSRGYQAGERSKAEREKEKGV